MSNKRRGTRGTIDKDGVDAHVPRSRHGFLDSGLEMDPVGPDPQGRLFLGILIGSTPQETRKENTFGTGLEVRIKKNKIGERSAR
jgi:hypothetical protein